jgi:uncharacterized protein
MTHDITRPIALVTGASSGIGEAFARHLAGSGYDLILTARRTDRLETLAREFQGSGGAVQTLTADLGTRDGLAGLETFLHENPVDLLVNNAGFGLYTPLANANPDDLEAMVYLNVIAVMRLTRAALPGMIAREGGAIINVGSGLAFNPTATRATYSGTKAFLLNFTQSLAEELEGSGVKLQALIPGLIQTEFHQHSGTDLSRIPPHMVMSAPDVASAAMRGLELGELVCVPALPDLEDVRRFEAARGTVAQNLIRNGQLADRYRP